MFGFSFLVKNNNRHGARTTNDNQNINGIKITSDKFMNTDVCVFKQEQMENSIIVVQIHKYKENETKNKVLHLQTHRHKDTFTDIYRR